MMSDEGVSSKSPGLGYSLVLTELDETYATFTHPNNNGSLRMPAEDWRSIGRPGRMEVEMNPFLSGGIS